MHLSVGGNHTAWVGQQLFQLVSAIGFDEHISDTGKHKDKRIGLRLYLNGTPPITMAVEKYHCCGAMPPRQGTYVCILP